MDESYNPSADDIAAMSAFLDQNGGNLPSPPEWDSILTASQKNDADEVVRLIINDGVPVTHSNVVGQTSLHIAAMWGCGIYEGYAGGFRGGGAGYVRIRKVC
mmetsp:Transcript_35614/g.85937  ORF Transcript_35614/g.85937 Transcript_35614/m.85937 type:complete len:102 (+) Transcript_35614:257-562(+)